MGLVTPSTIPPLPLIRLCLPNNARRVPVLNVLQEDTLPVVRHVVHVRVDAVRQRLVDAEPHQQLRRL